MAFLRGVLVDVEEKGLRERPLLLLRAAVVVVDRLVVVAAVEMLDMVNCVCLRVCWGCKCVYM